MPLDFSLTSPLTGACVRPLGRAGRYVLQVTILFWLAAGLVAAGLVYRGSRIWIDAGLHDFGLAPQLRWAVWGSIAPSRYWWDARIQALSSTEREGLLARETRRLDLSRADALRCPLCGAEIAAAWTLTAEARPDVAPGPVQCPRCDFRLDACRHCRHFLPGGSTNWAHSSWERNDVTTGRCSRYSELQRVEQACPPHMARHLRNRGYEQVSAPRVILDSYVPPEHCSCFQADRKRVRSSEIDWPDIRRAALLRLLGLGLESQSAAVHSPKPSHDPWLL
jgi:hypothetical protein